MSLALSIKSFGKRALFGARYLDRRARKIAPPGTFHILSFHRVATRPDPYFPAVSVASFEAQMRYLARRFRVRELGDIVRSAARGLPIQPGTVAVTFDDATACTYRLAFPILARLGLRATVFVPTRAIDAHVPLWTERVSAAFRAARATSVEFGGEVHSLIRPSARLAALAAAKAFLKSCTAGHRLSMLQEIIRDLRPFDAAPPPSHMTWDELRALARAGWGIGAHTVTHPILRGLSAEALYGEVVGSQKRIEEEIQSPCRLFAYPNGERADYDEFATSVVGRAFDAACTNIPGLADLGREPHELRRITESDAGPAVLAFKLALLART
jgi:peptidoglycan/xylan/chitin deacetylase (PgdA/CDA1 family)